MTFLSEIQLFWLEELPDSFVEIYTRPQGEPFIKGMIGKVVKIRDLNNIVRDHPLENLWRSWVVYENAAKSKIIGCLPAVIDIDDESDRHRPLMSPPLQKVPNLQKAYELTRICSDIIIEQWAKSEDHVRIVFSGCKGFHIEFKPVKSADTAIIREEIIKACVRKGLANTYNIFFETTTIDNTHDEVRLTGSVNSWKNDKGHIQQRRVIQLSFDEFLSLKLEGVILKSELFSG